MDHSINLFVSLFHTALPGSTVQDEQSASASEFMDMVKGHTKPEAAPPNGSEEGDIADTLDQLRQQLSALSRKTEENISAVIQSGGTAGQIEAALGQSISQFWAILDNFDHQNGTSFVADISKKLINTEILSENPMIANNFLPIGKDSKTAAIDTILVPETGKAPKLADSLAIPVPPDTKAEDHGSSKVMIGEALHTAKTDTVAEIDPPRPVVFNPTDMPKAAITLANPEPKVEKAVVNVSNIVAENNPSRPVVFNTTDTPKAAIAQASPEPKVEKAVVNAPDIVAENSPTNPVLDTIDTPETGLATDRAINRSSTISATRESGPIASNLLPSPQAHMSQKSDFFRQIFDRLNGTDTQVKISHGTDNTQPVQNGKTTADVPVAIENRTSQTGSVPQVSASLTGFGNILRSETAELRKTGTRGISGSRIATADTGKTPADAFTQMSTATGIAAKATKMLFVSAQAVARSTETVSELRDLLAFPLSARPDFQATHAILKADSPPPTPSASFSKNIAAQIPGETLKPGQTRIELAPRGLGSIVIDLQPRESGGIHVMLRAENSAVLHALRTDRDALMTVLSTTGASSDKISLDFGEFSQGGFNHERPESGLPAQNGPRFEDELEEPVTPINQPAHNGLLDIFT